MVHPPLSEGSREHTLASSSLGEIEITLLVRSSVLNHNRLSNQSFCFNSGVDGTVCAAVAEAIARWQQRHALRLPSLGDLLAEEDPSCVKKCRVA